ncbi:MAG: DJ-1/PfpI family protein [Planctomycetes bacterium]|nr:DJ-1/PfpI family protein [Planctomycetota bacterium]
MSKKRIIVPLAPGFEEIEAVTIVDVLRRAGLEVVLAALDPGPVRGAHGLTMLPDAVIDDLDPEGWAMVVLPGGLPGAEHLTNDQHVQTMLRRVLDGGGKVAAICAAPMAFGPSGLAADRATTCYPGFEKRFVQKEHLDCRVVVDGPVITSRGPGTALEFALTLVEELEGAEAAAKLQTGMLVARAEEARRIS